MLDLQVPAPIRLAPGILGLNVLAHDSVDTFSFLITPRQSTSTIDVAEAVSNALRAAIGIDDETVIDEISLLLPTGALPIARGAMRVADLANALQPLIRAA